MRTRIIEVAGKKYTLTANRSIIRTIANIAPEMLKLGQLTDADEIEKSEVDVGLKIMSELDVLFYDMIKIAHPEISKDKSDEILDLFEKEYSEVQANLIKFAMSVFTEGDPNTKKKKLNW